MSVKYSSVAKEEIYNEIYPRLKAEGLSDRDADIITNAKMYPRSVACMANKHDMTIEEVEAVYDSYYGR